MKYLITKILALTFAVTVTLFAASHASAQATITIQNNDAAGVGFNDATPATPVGANNGTTVGQQRLIAVQAAASIWGATLTSGPTITIRANWEAITAGCTANGGPLASAGNSGNIWRDFSGAVPGFWYGNALANAISNQDRNGSGTPEINARFNLSVGTPGCLENLSWYYGLDNNHGSNGVDLVSIALHEFGHGLGFQTFTSSTTGAQAGSQPSFPSIYDRYLFDKTTNKSWPNMTDAERVSSAINTGNLVWTGPQVTADVPSVLGTPRFRVNSPAAIAGNYTVGTADFGPRLSPSATTASVVQAQDSADGAGPSTTDGCSALTNPSAISGKIAFIDRGSCNFVLKVKNAQNAGAVGVIVANNASSPAVIQMGGSDSTITIPSLMISLADGNSVKSQLGAGVNASLLLDTTVPGGADSQHHALLYAPSALAQGSSVSHWDMSLFPNQLMEPSDSGDLFHSVSLPYDLTLSLMKDIGWPTNAATAFSILLEAGTANTASAVDSVTRERGPFTVLTTHNFSADGQRRLMIFTTDLGLSLGDTTGLSVQAGGIPLQVESAGPVNGVAATSFIIVKLANLQSNSTYALTVTRGGATSTNAPTIQIQ